MLNGQEAPIERDVEFGGKNLLWVKRVIVPKLLQDLPCFWASASHQGVEHFEVRRPSRSDQVIDIGCQELVDFDSSCCRFGFPYPCRVDVLANVEGFAGHIAVS